MLALLFALCVANGGVTDLPILALPANHPPHGTFAIMLTGDGGWRRIDARVTDRFREKGVPVVGFRTNVYFNTRRTAEESACALERVMRYYKLHWKCDRVMLIGYSRGADILPFMASRLPPDLRASTEVIALLGLEPMIDFRYHPSWIPFYHPKEQQFAVKPELEKLRGSRILCVYGEKEKNTLCRALDPQLATAVREPGSHHFAGRYDNIADVILESVEQTRKAD
ncbi:MAG TPA: AcvB/VirJ family lysyl-phosphatidylglycerol hydrolase [Thermoanaerobaculia bacterium]